MASEVPPSLEIDEHLLIQIFPNSLPSTIKIFDETGFKSIRLGQFSEIDKTFGTDKVVFRIEKSESPESFQQIAAFQQLASTILPELVPKTFLVGKAKTSDGFDVQFSVVEFIEGVVLDKVWHLADTENRKSIVATITFAMGRLYSVSLADEQIQKILHDTPLVSDGLRVGGPEFGYFEGSTGLVLRIIQYFETWRPRVLPRIDLTTADLVIEPGHPDMESAKVARISQAELKELAEDVVFSFMDFEPRNIMVREVWGNPDSSGQKRYEVAAIIDWEISGFFPRGFEFFYKDMELGRGCEYYDWYRLFRDGRDKLLPMPLKESQVKLFEAMDLARRSRMSRVNKNVGLNVQKKWMEMEKVELTGPEEGWVNSVNKYESVFVKSRADFEELEEGVEKELGWV